MTAEDDMYQIIFNLVENAIKYNCDDGVVHIVLRRTDDDVCLVVEDTGIGIPQDELAYVFERFYRVDKGRSRKMGGTGLGLAIVKHAVQFHGGTITASNCPNGGLRFDFTLRKHD